MIIDETSSLGFSDVVVTLHSGWCSAEVEAEFWERVAEDIARVLRRQQPAWPSNQPAEAAQARDHAGG